MLMLNTHNANCCNLTKWTTQENKLYLHCICQTKMKFCNMGETIFKSNIQQNSDQANKT